ncbi:complexed with cef1p [Dispira parvispora]|uniref:Complexed with cef1p n=1 Tax=Dispira parvispora TaxID=1520584 RepID=A0A9W8AWG0_9FUNG|nr:complexed with cef1p [Dispira parvispora]
MTTAARPTFDPAKGGENRNPKIQLSARDLPSHTQLKYRAPPTDTSEEKHLVELREQLLEAERVHFSKSQGEGSAPTDAGSPRRQLAIEAEPPLDVLDDEKRRQLLEQVKGWDVDESDEDTSSNESDEDDHSADQRSSSEGPEDSSDDSEDEDETVLLLRELEKIKRERAEEEAKKKQQQILLEESQRSIQVLQANPLLNLSSDHSFAVKRRWDDDVVFKNQAKDVDDRPQKRFINDMLRSDFHKKFMSKYIR